MANQDGGSKSNNGSSKTFTPSDTTDIYRIGVRPPSFWAEEPAVWFSQLEGNFVLSGIKDDDTKFYYVTSTLEHRYAAEVKDIIVSPPKTGKYERLKSELIKRLSTSREKEVKQLLMHEELGDRRPSQFLRHLQQLAGPTVPEEFIKTIWTSRLPTTLQPIIVSQKRLDLLALADLADSVHEIIPCSPQIATTSALKATEPSLASMAKQIDELSQAVEGCYNNTDLGRNTSFPPCSRMKKNHDEKAAEKEIPEKETPDNEGPVKKTRSGRTVRLPMYYRP
ncbi:uncharacterized protein LOC119629372 [Bombyx mori]|uniref:DUF7041 domain-containing protein n=1 Tax=Bombyx mori TaxID=7091 RepID=A0A8R2R123_BOMMO|nr:uncharacterized protein LOC119629372 [Bombyx mori]